MKTYHSLDVKSQQARIEPYINDEYSVHAEDFEDINDIIDRAMKTNTKPDFGSKRDDLVYDEALDAAADEFDRLEQDGEQSELPEARECNESAQEDDAEPELSLTQ